MEATRGRRCPRPSLSCAAMSGGSCAKGRSRLRRLKKYCSRVPPPLFFVTAESKGVTGTLCVSADSKELRISFFAKWMRTFLLLRSGEEDKPEMAVPLWEVGAPFYGS